MPQNEKVFEHYQKFSTKLRLMVIDEMQATDRCRFRKCSKKCNKEVESSKNYTQDLFITFSTERHSFIRVIHGKDGNNIVGFILEITDRFGDNLKRCLTLNHEELWRVQLEKSTDLLKYAIAETKTTYKTYQRTVKKLHMRGLALETDDKKLDIDFGIESLDKLEDLHLTRQINITQFLSKLRRPLMTLCVEGEYNKHCLLDHEQVYQVRQSLKFWTSELNNSTFLRLSAKNVNLCVGELTEKDIFNFIRSWQNGTIGKEIEIYRLTIDNSNFNVHRFLKLLRVSDREQGTTGKIEIKHYEKSGRSGSLRFSQQSLEFNTTLSTS